ncbi:ORF64 [Ictalurid herpesvirus 1]|nr:ORF64 [Ictalurid herpesvirus 1]
MSSPREASSMSSRSPVNPEPESDSVDSEWVFGKYRLLSALRSATLEGADLEGGIPQELLNVLVLYEKMKVTKSELSGFVTYLALMTLGIFDFDRSLKRLVDEGVLGMFRFNRMLTRVFFGYATGEDVLIEGLLDTWFAFMVLLARFPIIPAQLIDSNFCVLCMYESDHSLATADTRFKTILCDHFTEASVTAGGDPCDSAEVTAVVKKTTQIDLSLDDFHERVARGDNVRELAVKRDTTLTTRKNGSINNFTKALNRARETCAMDRMESSLVEFQKKLREVNNMINRLTNPKNLNIFAAELFNVFVHAHHRRKTIRERLSGGLGDWKGRAAHMLFLTTKLRTAVDKNLLTTIITEFYAAAVPPVYKYNHKYNMHAHRVIFFKHMESIGFTNEGITAFQYQLNQVDLREVVGQDYRSDIIPITTNAENFNRLTELFWVIANICTFIFIHNKTIKLHHGDAPDLNIDELPDGLYLFNGSVGFKHDNGETRSGVWSSERTLDLLDTYDQLLSTGVIG